MTNRKHRDCMITLYLKQCNIPSASEWDDELANERIVCLFGFPAGKRKFLKLYPCPINNFQRSLCSSDIMRSQKTIQALEIGFGFKRDAEEKNQLATVPLCSWTDENSYSYPYIHATMQY